MRYLSIIVAAAGTTLCTSANAQPEWNLIVLGPATNCEEFDRPNAQNNLGDVAGGWPSMWSVGESGWFRINGVTTVLTPCRESSVRAMTDDRFMVGFVDEVGTGQGWPKAAFWSVPGASPRLLGSGRGGEALAVNRTHDIVGRYGLCGLCGHKAAIWKQSNNYQPTILPGSGTDNAAAHAINDSGVIVGWRRTGSPPNHTDRARVWIPNAGVYGSPIGIGTAGGTHSRAEDVNESGRVLVRTQNAAEHWVVALWENGILTNLGTLGFDDAFGWDFNERGDIVGWGTVGGTDSAFMYRNGQVIDLAAHTAGLSSWDSTHALKINEGGQIIGWGEINGVGHGFVLEPVCYADCDQSTGAGVLDIFDFLCFQDNFVNAEPYACECDTSTGPGVCDIFDFLCFQNAFVNGCP